MYTFHLEAAAAGDDNAAALAALQAAGDAGLPAVHDLIAAIKVRLLWGCFGSNAVVLMAHLTALAGLRMSCRSTLPISFTGGGHAGGHHHQAGHTGGAATAVHRYSRHGTAKSVAVQGGRNMPVQLFKLQPCCRTRCTACSWACRVCRLTQAECMAPANVDAPIAFLPQLSINTRCGTPLCLVATWLLPVLTPLGTAGSDHDCGAGLWRAELHAGHDGQGGASCCSQFVNRFAVLHDSCVALHDPAGTGSVSRCWLGQRVGSSAECSGSGGSSAAPHEPRCAIRTGVHKSKPMSPTPGLPQVRFLRSRFPDLYIEVRRLAAAAAPQGEQHSGGGVNICASPGSAHRAAPHAARLPGSL